MNPLRIKVCGITRHDNMLDIAALQPDFMGFIFYPPGKRNVSRHIHRLPLADLPPSIKKVAVMVNQPLEEADALIRKYGFDLIQLHGSESPDYCRKLQESVPVIKAFSIGENLPENLPEYEDCCDYFLFDAMGKNAGGNGIAFDHGLLKGYAGEKPFFLAGGISPEFDPGLFFTSAVTASGGVQKCMALDINSRFETAPGIKDVKRVEEFINQIRNK